jgi:hypothetical protein
MAGERSAGAIGGSSKFTTTEPARLSVGALALRKGSLAAMDFASSEGEEGHPIQGILGYPFFAQRVVTLDYPRHTLIVGGNRGAGSVVPLRIEAKTPVIEASLAMRTTVEKVRLVVDTGFDDTIILTSPFVERHGWQNLGVAGTSGKSLGGETISRVARARRLSIGDVDFDDVRVRLATDREGAFASNDVDGYVGSGLLQHCVVTFDYRAGSMTLRCATRNPTRGP